MNILKKIKNRISPRNPPIPPYAQDYIKIFSHPRSGTHFLEAFVAENFYKGEDLFLPDVNWGHWANRKINSEGNRYQKLFGSHIFPDKSCKKINFPVVYIYRDGRAVAYSVWKTENFIHPDKTGITFADFLRLPMDWKGSPSFKHQSSKTIAQHWDMHVRGWIDIAKKNENVVIVNYEELISNPHKIYKQLHQKFFEDNLFLNPEEINNITNAVGLKPNKAVKDSWKEIFTKNDNSFFIDQLHDSSYLSFPLE